MSDIDESSETHHLPFQTPAGRLEDLPLETDSSVDSEKEQRETSVLFRLTKRNIAKQVDEQNVEFSSNNIHSETAPYDKYIMTIVDIWESTKHMTW